MLVEAPRHSTVEKKSQQLYPTCRKRRSFVLSRKPKPAPPAEHPSRIS
jgi:hypothetical protein